MNAEDLAVLGTLTRRTAGVLDHVRRLARLVPAEMDPTAAIAEIKALETDIEAFVDALAAREAASWGRHDHEPRIPPPRRLATPALPLSTEVEPHMKVERLGIDGRPKGHAAPQPSGHWTQWRGKEKR